MLHDVFICHASEDKDDFARPLAEALRAHHLEVWYDEFTLSVGDSLRETIDRGLSSSRFGIVVLSPSFIQKRWPIRELNGLVARETAEGRKLILPVWHNVGRDDVLKFSPPLADLRASLSEAGIDTVVNELLQKIRPERSPLIVARDFLIEKGVSTPVVSDEWWLNIIEIKEADFRYPDLNLGWRWIFPLPFPDGYDGKERGLNIAWTALQLEWAEDGKKRNICQLTHPEGVHTFLRKWPGLFECAHNNPATLALYAPQLTIPGFDDGFSDVFDELLAQENISSCEAFRYGRAETTDEREPLCGDLIAWRHPTYGNFTASELSYEFVNAQNASYSRKVFDGFECLVWLLSNDSNWMPENLRETLTQGFRDRVHWWLTELVRWDDRDAIADMLWRQPQREFSYTSAIVTALHEHCGRASSEMKLTDDSNRVATKFIERGFIEGYFEEQRRFKEIRGETGTV